MSGRGAPLVIGEYHGPRGRRLAAPRRRRRALRLLLVRTFAVLGLGALLVWTGHWLLTAPVFAVVRVESGPYRFSDRHDVEEALGVCLGRNIWTLSRAQVAAACSTLPWVRDVRLERRIPDTAQVTLLEWRPLLAVADPVDPGRELLLVGDGRLLALPDHHPSPVLPLLIGAEVAADGAGRWRLAGRRPAAVLELVAAMAASGLESADPVDFVRATAEGFVLVLAGGRGSLLLGHEDFQGRLARFLLARPRIPEGAAVDLRFEDRITFVPPGSDRT
jgi:cell division septal protein FtsQ